MTVLEHSPAPGGASSSVEATLPGFVHDHCAGFNPMTVASPAMRELNLEAEGLRWVRPDAIMAHPFEDGTAIALHHDLAATVASLEAAHPGAGVAWGELIEQYRPLAQRLVEAILGPLPPVRQSLALGAALRRDGLLLARRMAGSVEAFGLDVFNGARRPTAWLAGSAQHSGLPPSTAGSGAFGFLLQLLGHSHGWPYPAGGQGQITSALLGIAAREGVTVRCQAHVERILVRAGRVVGVQAERRRTAAGSRCGVHDQCPPAGRDPSRASAARSAAASVAYLALRNRRLQAGLRAAHAGAVDGSRGARGHRRACGRRPPGAFASGSGREPGRGARAPRAGCRTAHPL